MSFQWKVIFLLAFVVANISSEPEEDSLTADTTELEEDLDCVLNYLQEKKIIKGKFGEGESNTTQPDDACIAKIERYKKNSFDKGVEAMRRDNSTEEYADCVMNQLQSMADIGDVEIKAFYYRTTKNVSNRKRKNFLRATRNSRRILIETMLKNCIFKDNFGKMFDDLSTSTNHTDTTEDDETSYCIKKHLNDTDFYDKSIYDVNINPKNIDISQVNCDDEYTSAVEELEETFLRGFLKGPRILSEAREICIRNAFANGNIVDHYFFAMVLGEIEVTDEQKTIERTKFVDAMDQLVFETLKCHY